jgi:hypothetical protein
MSVENQSICNIQSFQQQDPVNKSVFVPIVFKSVEEKVMYNILVKDKPDFLDNAQLQLKYLEKNRILKIECKNAGVHGVLVGGVLGAGGMLAYQLYVGIVCPIFAALSIIFCAILGGSIGGGVCVAHKYYTINKSKAFIDWKMEAIKNDVYKKFADCIDSDNELKGLICPIYQELIIDPVQDECGHTYERCAINKYLSDHNGVISCPMGAMDEPIVDLKTGKLKEVKKKIHIQNLKDDRTYHDKVCKRLFEIVKVIEDSDIKKGITAYLKAKVYEYDQMYNKEMNLAINRANLRDIDHDVYSQDVIRLLDWRKQWAAWPSS